jgi:type IV pilus assembly protein PilN
MSTRINLLPWREMRRREQDRQMLTVAVASWLLMGVVVFYAHVHVSAMIENQNLRNKFLQDEIKKVEEEIKEIAELKKKRQDLIARMNVIYELQGDRTRVVRIFDEIARRLPEGVYLTSLKQTGGSLALQGLAQSNGRVAALMRNLAASDLFLEPVLEVIKVKEQGGSRLSEFSMNVKPEARPDKLEAGA